MDIREFVFRHMHSNSDADDEQKEIDLSIRNSEIKNDPECRDFCGRFLWSEIFHGGLRIAIDQYSPEKWEPVAEYFINNIVPSNEFMHDCIAFFDDIRQGKGENYLG